MKQAQYFVPDKSFEKNPWSPWGCKKCHTCMKAIYIVYTNIPVGM